MKQIITETIYSKHFNGDNYDVKYSDLPKDIQDNDIIEINREADYYSESNSWTAYTELSILRPREETDEEYNKRIEKENKTNVELKQKRYERYLTLKKEFEPSENIQF